VQRQGAQHRLSHGENGWPDHGVRAAFPFARGEIALDSRSNSSAPAQREGRRLFLTSCISCHDRARVADEGPAWSSRPVSYPRMGFVPGQPNTHRRWTRVQRQRLRQARGRAEGGWAVARRTRGEKLFQANCAFCHGGDGTGKNWIGQFMEPKARDLTQYTVQSLPPTRLRR
jgi:cytochrome c oxidase cbb3-type subunit 3